jgi:hypothetical protein
MHLGGATDQWRALVATVMNFPVPQNAANLSTIWEWWASQEALLHGVVGHEVPCDRLVIKIQNPGKPVDSTDICLCSYLQLCRRTLSGKHDSLTSFRSIHFLSNAYQADSQSIAANMSRCWRYFLAVACHKVLAWNLLRCSQTSASLSAIETSWSSQHLSSVHKRHKAQFN